MRRLADFILRYAIVVSLFCLALAAAGTYYSVELYKNLRTDIEELLPTTARSVVDMNEVTSRLESIDNLAVLVFSKNGKASRRFVDDLAAKLSKAPKDIVSSVEYKIDRELDFFKARRPLYMDAPDLARIRDYISHRIDYEKQLYNPLNIFRETELPEPRLDLMGMKKKYESKISSYSRFPEGYYATPDETQRVVLIYIPGQAGISGARKLKSLVETTIAELTPGSYAPDLRVAYTGGVQNNIEEQGALVADLELSTVIVMVLVSIAMFVFFRAPRATIALLTSLFMGTLWTFGASFFAVGYLNANSAFLGSIVIGNGINCGIIFLARYLEERRNGVGHDDSIRTAMTRTATATLTASLAAALAYGSLVLTGFRGFRQFGIIGLIGMTLCWLSAYIALPALLTVLDRMRPLVKKGARPPRAWFAELMARFVQKFPRAIWGTTFAVSIAAALTFPKLYGGDLLQSDLSKLRNKKSMTEGSGYLSKYVDEIFQRYLSPTVILPRTGQGADAIAKKLKERQKADGPNGLIVNVQTLEDFIPADQGKKIQMLRDIRELLPPKLLKRIGPEDRKLVGEFLTESSMHQVNQTNLPRLILDKFTEKSGAVGRLVLVEPPLNSSSWGAETLEHYVGEIREVADSIEPGAPVAGSLPVSADLMASIIRDGPRATLFAFLAVVALVVVLYREVRTIGLILFSLLLGVLWLFGAILAFDIKINFLNFIALPITFGIGVDYGVNILQRFRQEGPESILKVIRDTGGAVVLASFTTIVGYSSLLIADNQAFVSFGVLAVLGEVTCVVAAILSLPAFLLTYQGRGQGKKQDLKAETPVTSTA